MKGRTLLTSLMLTAGLGAIYTLLVVAVNTREPERLAAAVLYTALLVTLTFLMLSRGVVSPYRRIFYVAFAALFVVDFVCQAIEVRGSFFLTLDAVESHNISICHIALPLLALPLALERTLFFPTQLFAPLGFYRVTAVTLLGLVVLGKAWCAWACPMGGLDELFASLGRRDRLGTRGWSTRWKYAPWALLIFLALISPLTLKPVFCQWLCPFKMVFECAPIVNAETLVQFIVFVAIGLSLIVALPLLTKKRTQCALFCPFGPVAAAAGCANPFRVRRDLDRCTRCGACADACPLFCAAPGEYGEAMPRGCARCGACIDACPRGALRISLPGVGFDRSDRVFSGRLVRWPALARSRIAFALARGFDELLDGETLFLAVTLVFACGISSNFAVNALVRLFNLALRGSLIIT